MVTRSPAMSSDPPLFTGARFVTPFRPSQSHSSKIPTTVGPPSRVTARRSPMWWELPYETSTRSALGGFFIEAGQAGLSANQGSNRMRLPPGVLIRNVACPNQVIASRCIEESPCDVRTNSNPAEPRRHDEHDGCVLCAASVVTVVAVVVESQIN